MERSTHAALTNSTLGTTTPGFTGAGVTALDIAANASQSAASNVIGFAVGFGGAAASGVVNSFAALTSATLDQGLVTAGRVGVNAESRNGFYAQAVSGAAGGVGIGRAFVVGTSRNATLATIGGGAGQTDAQPQWRRSRRGAQRQRLHHAGGGRRGRRLCRCRRHGQLRRCRERDPRRALWRQRDAAPGRDADSTVRPAAGISVTANETTSITPTTAAGANGSFGAGAAANIASLDSRVLADITGSDARRAGCGLGLGDLRSHRSMRRRMTYGVGGSAGIGAAVALISVGTGTPSGAQGEINAGGNGTLSRVNQLTAGNADLVLSATGLGELPQLSRYGRRLDERGRSARRGAGRLQPAARQRHASRAAR